MRHALPLLLLTTLVGCAGNPPAEPVPPAKGGTGTPAAIPPTPGADRYSMARDTAPNHRPDTQHIREPEVRHEPRSRYGNHSPYMVFGQTYHVMASGEGYRADGIASWYGAKFHGHRTSSGEPYDMYQFSAAHRSLPLPSFARVTNLDNGKSVVVRVNDRGPFHPDREIDLSWAAAHRLGIEQSGTGRVRVEVLTPSAPATVATTTPPRSSTAAAAPNAGMRAAVDSPPPPAELYLQVGAFSRPQTAQQLADRLVAQFSYPVAVRDSASDSALYRVWVGPFATEPLRENAHDQLYRSGYGEPLRVMP